MALSLFQFLVAQEMRKSQYVHLGINPTVSLNSAISVIQQRPSLKFDQDILNQVEVDKFYAATSGEEQNHANRQAGARLLEYIEFAWKDEQTLHTLCAELTSLVSQSIERARKEKIPELEAKELPRIQGSLCRSEDPISIVVVPLSTGHEATVSHEMIESDSTHSSASSSIVSGNADPTRRTRSNLEPHRYTSLLWEHAAKIGSVPRFKKEQLSLFPSRWTYTVTFAGLSENGEGRNAKMAMHEACRQLYYKLDI
jgi:hypothetical protein